MARRAALFASFAAAAVFIGCGGADQTDGTQAEQDAEASKRQDDMRSFYAKKPFPKAKKQH